MFEKTKVYQLLGLRDGIAGLTELVWDLTATRRAGKHRLVILSPAAGLAVIGAIAAWLLRDASHSNIMARAAEQVLTSLAGSEWFHWLGGALVGFVGGVWLDAFIGRKGKGARPQSKQAFQPQARQIASALSPLKLIFDPRDPRCLVVKKGPYGDNAEKYLILIENSGTSTLDTYLPANMKGREILQAAAQTVGGWEPDGPQSNFASRGVSASASTDPNAHQFHRDQLGQADISTLEQVTLGHLKQYREMVLTIYHVTGALLDMSAIRRGCSWWRP